MLIRQIRPDDDSQVAGIIRQVMTEFGAVGNGFSIEDAEVDEMSQAYACDRSRFYVVQQDRQLVGCGGIAQLHGAAQDICELRKMYFLPQARGQGVGKLLTRTLLQDAARIGFRKVYLETLESMKAANRMYRQLGFVPLEKSLGRTGHHGCDRYYMIEVELPDLDPRLLV